MRRICCLTLVALLAVTSLSAAELGKFADWNESPEGYFMTKAEREQWGTLTSEADAAKFVAEFLAKRDAGFPEEVKKRAEQADKYLTLGKVKGSKSLRGKVIVLMGPPSGMSVSAKTKTETKRDSPAVAGAMSNIGPSSSGRNGDSSSIAGNSISTSQELRIYTISFDGATAKSVGRDKVTFEIEAEAATGKDRFASRDGERDAQAIFELAARASMKK